MFSRDASKRDEWVPFTPVSVAEYVSGPNAAK